MRSLGEFVVDVLVVLPLAGLLAAVGYFLVFRPIVWLLAQWEERRAAQEREADRRWCLAHGEFIAPARGNWSNAFAELDPGFTAAQRESCAAQMYTARQLACAPQRGACGAHILEGVDTPGGVGGAV